MRLVYYLNSLPYFTIKVINTSQGLKSVEFTSLIYKNKTKIHPQSWSSEYTDHEVLYSPEVEKWLMNITGYKQVVTWSL